jgi:IQ motif/SEC7 domain-containing protein
LLSFACRYYDRRRRREKEIFYVNRHSTCFFGFYILKKIYSITTILAIDDGEDLDINYLTGIYERIRAQEFRPDNDHVTQVAKFEQTLIGKKPALAVPHRRLVCYCRLYEIYDLSKRERLTSHQREVFLFNDLLIVS